MTEESTKGERISGAASKAGDSVENAAAAAASPSPLPPPENNHNKRKRDRSWIWKLIEEQKDSSYTKYPHHPLVQGKILATAPMIEQSDTAFRLLCRKYGSNLCWTPMIHAHSYVKKHEYRSKLYQNQFLQKDRPLIAQIAGSNQDILLECAQMLLDRGGIDAIDLNLGCPTLTAKRGRYGAYLLPSPHVVDLVRHLAQNLTCPVTCKVRLVPLSRAKQREQDAIQKKCHEEGTPYDPVLFDLEASIKLYQALIDAGASMLTIHGRTKDMKGEHSRAADRDAIRTVVQKLGDQVPIIANGNLSSYQDVIKCLQYTKADGCMSSEAILEYPPALFVPHNEQPPRPGPGRIGIARGYMELALQYPPLQGNGASGMQCLQMHMNTFLHGEFLPGCEADEDDKEEFKQELKVIQASIMSSTTPQDLMAVLDQLEERQKRNNHDIKKENLTWYYRHWKVKHTGER